MGYSRIFKRFSFVTVLITIAAILILYFLALIVIPQIQIGILRFISLSPQLSSAIIAGIIALIVSPLTAFLARRWENESTVRQAIRETKIPIYNDYMKYTFRLMFSEIYTSMTPLTEKDRDDFESEKFPLLITWASDKVLKHYIEFNRKRNMAVQYASEHFEEDQTKQLQKEALYEFEELLKAFRTDVGQSNNNLDEGDLLSLFISDYNKL